ncbi:MAG: hypothetical protein AB7P21_30055 [Lautropia sp.]
MNKFIESRGFASFLRIATVLLVIEGVVRIAFADSQPYAGMSVSNNIISGLMGLGLAVATFRKSREIDAKLQQRP